MRTRRQARLIAGAAITALSLVLTGCGDEDKDPPATGGGTTAPTTAGATTSAPPQVKLVKSGQVTTCTNLPYPPFQFEKGGKIVGFDVELGDMVAAALGVKQEIVDTPFEGIKTGADLNAGKCDMAAAGMTITDERKANLDFSDPYFDATQALMAKKGSGITSLETAKGKKVGAQSSTTGEDFVKKAGIDPVSFEDSAAELNGLRTGQVDVIVQDLPTVSEWLKDPANKDFEIVANLDTGEQYGFAVKKGGNDELLKVINDTIAKAKSDGTYDALYKKWIGEDPPK